MSAFILFGMLWFLTSWKNMLPHSNQNKTTSNNLAVLFSMCLPLGVH